MTTQLIFPHQQIETSHHSPPPPPSLPQYTSFTINQPKKKGIKLGLSLVFIDSIDLKIDFLNTLVKSLEENDFFLSNQEYNFNLLDLVTKKTFYCDY